MASLTITVPDDQVDRIRAALGQALNMVDGVNGGFLDATTDQVRQYLRDSLKGVVYQVEQENAARAAAQAVAPPDITLD